MLLYVRSMPQRNNQLSVATLNRLATVDGLLQLGGTLLLALALVLLITNGGAG